MTCIVGLVHEGSVYIGGDSAGVSGWLLQVRADEKVFHLTPEIVVGFTTSFRMGKLIRYRTDVPALPEDDTEMNRWMCVSFMDAVRKALSDGGYRKKENEREEGGEFLVGVRDRLFYVGGDFQAGECASGFAAVGCGQEQALNALYATHEFIADPAARVRAALKASEALCAGVRSPFYILSTDESA